MVLEILVNTGSGNGLLPDGTKPLPEPMLTHWPLGDFNKILQKIIFKLILVTDGCDISGEIAQKMNITGP